MSLIGLIFFAVGGVALLMSIHASVAVFLAAILFQAASAVTLAGTGLIPAILALAFLGLAVVIRRGVPERMIGAALPGQPGFYLLVYVVWGVFAAMMFPRLFAGMFEVFPLNVTDGTYTLQPVGPSSSNMSQSLYHVAGLFSFLAFAALMNSERAMVKLAYAVCGVAALHCAIGFIDLAVDTLGRPDLLNFIRNGESAQAHTQKIMGFKRMTGAMSEPSSFAGTSVVLFAFSLRLWRGGFAPQITGPVALAVLLVLTLAFSSTGYLCVAAYLAIVYSYNLSGYDRSFPTAQRKKRRWKFAAFGPLAALGVLTLVAFRPDLMEPVTGIFDETITTKMSSDSGVERMAWNMSALNAFVETSGLGLGVGSVRSSSAIAAVLATGGIFGATLLTIFLIKLFRSGRHLSAAQHASVSGQIAAAARSACLASLIANAVSSSISFLGFLFISLAGVALASMFFGRRTVSTSQNHRLPIEQRQPAR